MVLVCHEIPWMVLVCHEIPWMVLVCHDIPWMVLVCHDIPWIVLVCHDIPWMVLVCHDILITSCHFSLILSLSSSITSHSRCIKYIYLFSFFMEAQH